MSVPTLKEMLENMKSAMSNRDLSDDYIKANYPNCCTRDEAAYGEWSKGITMIPCNWVYPYLVALAEDDRLSAIVKEVEEEMED